MDNVLLKFVDLNSNSVFYIGNNTLWRILKGGLEGFSTVDNIVNYTNNATSDGGYIDSTNVPVKDRNVSCAYVFPNNNLVARQGVLDFFSVKNEYRLYVTYNETTLWADCYLVRMALSISTRFKDRLDLSLALRFVNPYWNANIPDIEDLNVSNPLFAFPYLCANDSTYTGPQGFAAGILVDNEYTTEIYNDGDVITYPVITIKFKGGTSNPFIKLNGHTVSFNYDFSSGETVVLDFDNSPPTVKKDGVNWVGYCSRNSEFESMGLVKGKNIFEYGADSGEDSMRVSVAHNNKYEAI